MADLIVRFIAGGIVVSVFAIFGDLFKPKSFAGLFAAAPSVALATLGLSLARHGSPYIATEGKTMMAGGVALAVYGQVVSWVLMRRSFHPLTVTSIAVLLWLAVALGLWAALFR